jgi:hypothetical protein
MSNSSPGNEKVSNGILLETNGDKSQELLFDRCKHRKHLGHFYFQDLKGSEVDEKKRISIEGFMRRHILLRLITGLCRGVYHFLLFLILLIPKKMSHFLTEHTDDCIIAQAGEGSLYREMMVRVPPFLTCFPFSVLAACTMRLEFLDAGVR